MKLVGSNLTQVFEKNVYIWNTQSDGKMKVIKKSFCRVSLKEMKFTEEI